MADWFTPTQVQKALETMWMKLENTTTIPLEEIKEDLINYYGKKQHITKSLQYDLYFNTKKTYDPKGIKDCGRSQKEILNNIYNEEIQRHVPVITSHLHGHRLNDLEGRSLNDHKKVENKSDYRRTGLPLDKNIGLPKNMNFLQLDD